MTPCEACVNAGMEQTSMPARRHEQTQAKAHRLPCTCAWRHRCACPAQAALAGKDRLAVIGFAHPACSSSVFLSCCTQVTHLVALDALPAAVVSKPCQPFPVNHSKKQGPPGCA